MATGKIKNIIFDLGGVLVDIDPRRTADALARLSGTPAIDIIGIHNSQNFFMDYEKGLITDREFRDHLRSFLNARLPDEVIDKAWGELLLDFPEQKIRLLEETRRKYKIFLLSNTNNIHRIKFESRFREITGEDIRDYFNRVHYSFEMHARKPDRDIFQKVLDENNLQPGETLLIDDHLPNIETADTMGFLTRHVTINQELIEIEI